MNWLEIDGLGTHIVSKPAKAPAAKRERKFIPFELEPQGAPQRGGSPFKYTAPKGWTKMPIRAGRIAVDVVGDHVGEERQLIAPALDVLIAHAGVGEGVNEVQARAARSRLQPDRHA